MVDREEDLDLNHTVAMSTNTTEVTTEGVMVGHVLVGMALITMDMVVLVIRIVVVRNGLLIGISAEEMHTCNRHKDFLLGPLYGVLLLLRLSFLQLCP